MANNAVNLDNIWDKIGAVTRDEVRLAVLQDEIEIHKSRLEPNDMGHLHTAISVIKHLSSDFFNSSFNDSNSIVKMSCIVWF